MTEPTPCVCTGCAGGQQQRKGPPGALPAAGNGGKQRVVPQGPSGEEEQEIELKFPRKRQVESLQLPPERAGTTKCRHLGGSTRGTPSHPTEETDPPAPASSSPSAIVRRPRGCPGAQPARPSPSHAVGPTPPLPPRLPGCALLFLLRLWTAPVEPQHLTSCPRPLTAPYHLLH